MSSSVLKKWVGILLLACAFGALDASGQAMRAMTSGDPNVSSTWDWIANNTYTLYFEQDGLTVTTRLPWYRTEGPVPDHVGANDVKPEDGWELLYRDFGVPGDGTSIPRFALYNKYTGLVRVFFYNRRYDKPFTSAFVEVSLSTYGSADNAKPASLAYYETSPTEYLDAYNESTAMTAATELVYREWGYFEFYATSFDPNVGQSQFEDAVFHFDMIGVDETQLTIDGDLSLDAVFTEGSNNLFNVVGNTLGGLDGTKAANVLRSYTDSTDHANKKDQQNSSFGQELIDLAASSLESYLPGIGQFAGFVGDFIGGTSSPRLKGFNGQIELTGEATTAYGGVNEFFIRVPGAPRTVDIGVPVIDEPIGVYSLDTKPVLNVYEDETCYDDAYGQDDYCQTEYRMKLQNPPQVNVNPRLTNEADVTVEVAYTSLIGSTVTDYMSPSELADEELFCFISDYGDDCQILPLWTGISLRLVIDSNTPGFEPVYIYDVLDPDQNDVPLLSDLSKRHTTERRGVETFEVVSSGPNPFHDRTTVAFTLPDAGHVTATVYDVMGRRVRTLADETMRPGRHDLTLSGRGLSPGTYFYRIQSDGKTLSGKMTLVR